MNLPIGLGTSPGEPRRLPLERARLTRRAAASPAVLVVDEEEEVRAELAGLLRRRGLAVLTATSGADALRLLASRPEIAVLVADIRLGAANGLALAGRAAAGRGAAEALEVVLVTGYVTPRRGPATRRPMTAADVASRAADALERAAAHRAAASAALPPARPSRTPAQAAEALLHSLAGHLAGSGPALEVAVRDIRVPLAVLLEAVPASQTEARRLLGLVDELLEVSAMEAGRLRHRPVLVSAHDLLTTTSARLAALGIGCARRITLAPEAEPAFLLDAPRLARALALLAARALVDCGGAAQAELSAESGAAGLEVELAILPAREITGEAAEPAPEASLAHSIARRMAAAVGGRLDASHLPGGGLRARLVMRGR